VRLVTAFVSDRGELYLRGCIEAYEANVDTQLVHSTTVIDDSDHKLGMAGAVRAAWTWALDASADWLFHVEEDMYLTAPVDLRHMVAIMDDRPGLAQLVLKRQPWSTEERQAGGIIEAHPDEYIDRGPCTEHGRIFSLNPCLIRRQVLELGWPDGNEAEFTRTCLVAGYSFAFYGARTDPPRVRHVGTERGKGWRL